MFSLLIPTILTSTADSLNPFAITQQFVLQGMVKKSKHILYFTLTTGIVNFIGGFLAYYGLVAIIEKFMASIMNKYGQSIYILEFILGIGFLMGVFYFLQNKKIESIHKQVELLNPNNAQNNDERQVASKIKSVTPISLIALGTIATISELTTALPYFAFLAILLNHSLSFIEVFFILVVYNFIYTSPLIALYILYIKKQQRFDSIYTFFKKQITKWSLIIAPTVMGLIGGFLIFHSMTLLI